MTTAPSPDTVTEDLKTAALSIRRARLELLKIKHGGKDSPTGRVLLPAAAHMELGNKDVVRDLARSDMDLSSTWERFIQGFTKKSLVSSGSIRNPSPTLLVKAEDNSLGLVHYKDMTCKLSFSTTATSNLEGLISLRVYRWNTDLLSSISATVFGQVDDDYSINVRQRSFIVSVSKNYPYQYEFTVPNMRLKADETFAIFAGCVGTSISVSTMLYGHYREMDKGGF